MGNGLAWSQGVLRCKLLRRSESQGARILSNNSVAHWRATKNGWASAIWAVDEVVVVHFHTTAWVLQGLGMYGRYGRDEGAEPRRV